MTYYNFCRDVITFLLFLKDVVHWSITTSTCVGQSQPQHVLVNHNLNMCWSVTTSTCVGQSQPQHVLVTHNLNMCWSVTTSTCCFRILNICLGFHNGKLHAISSAKTKSEHLFVMIENGSKQEVQLGKMEGMFCLSDFMIEYYDIINDWFRLIF